MNLLNKVSSTPSICEILLDFTGESINYSLQEVNFKNTLLTNGLITETHFQKGNVSFSEQSAESKAGLYFKQTLSITFNSSDKDRYERILKYHCTKNIIIVLNNGERFLMGRNDFKQNRRPKIESTNTHQKSTIEFYTESIVPISKYLGTVIVGLPEIIPLHFGIDPL